MEDMVDCQLQRKVHESGEKHVHACTSGENMSARVRVRFGMINFASQRESGPMTIAITERSKDRPPPGF